MSVYIYSHSYCYNYLYMNYIPTTFFAKISTCDTTAYPLLSQSTFLIYFRLSSPQERVSVQGQIFTLSAKWKGTRLRERETNTRPWVPPGKLAYFSHLSFYLSTIDLYVCVPILPKTLFDELILTPFESLNIFEKNIK